MSAVKLACFAVLLLGVIVAPAAAQMNLRAAQSQVAFEQRLGEQAPLDVRLRDETGRHVRLAELFDGKPVVLQFAYYRCPGLCPLSLGGLTDALRAVRLKLGDDFTVLTVSFDPGDSAEMAALKKAMCLEQLDEPSLSKGWHFLTGGESETRRLADAVGFRYAHDPATGQYAHASGIVVLTPDGVVSRYLFGIDYGPRDLRLALVDAAQGEIGSPADRVLLTCLTYDPVTGRYRFAAMTALRIAGLTTVVLITLYVGRGFIRERRRKSLAA